jgi:hypothetical protein
VSSERQHSTPAFQAGASAEMPGIRPVGPSPDELATAHLGCRLVTGIHTESVVALYSPPYR